MLLRPRLRLDPKRPKEVTKEKPDERTALLILGLVCVCACECVHSKCALHSVAILGSSLYAGCSTAQPTPAVPQLQLQPALPEPEDAGAPQPRCFAMAGGKMVMESIGDVAAASSAATVAVPTYGSTLWTTVQATAEQIDDEGYCMCRWPCAFVATNSGCMNGAGCHFCHAEHRPKTPIDRPSRNVRNKLKDIVRDFLVKGADQSILWALAERRPYLQRLLNEHLAAVPPSLRTEPQELDESAQVGECHSRVHATARDLAGQAALPVLGPFPPGLIMIGNTPPLSRSAAAAGCRQDSQRDPHRVLSKSIGNRLQWPDSGQQAPAQSDGTHMDENSDDDCSITHSEMAFELELQRLVAELGITCEPNQAHSSRDASQFAAH